MTVTTELNPEHAKWFEKERGIDLSTLDSFGIRSEGNEVVLPYPSFEKRRGGIGTAERKFHTPKGSRPEFFNSRDLDKPYVIVTEGETDCMKLWQEVGSEKIGVVGIPGVDNWNGDMARVLAGAEKVLFVMDNDEEYTTKHKVDAAWARIQRDLRSKASRLYLPEEIKDVCQFFKFYETETFLDLMKSTKRGQFHYTPLDFGKPPAPTDWMVEGLIAQGDFVLLQGEPNVGKSFLEMALAVAVAEGKSEFLKHAMKGRPGKVLIVDEENPDDVVRTRMRQLGLTPAGWENVRYLWEQGIKLDRDPHKLLDEARAFGPDLIILDSLSALHNQEENNNGAMAQLGTDGIKPLARETGATVILLHHTNKGDGSSMKRTRGASALNAVIDTGLDVVPTMIGDGFGGEVPACSLILYKTRRGKKNTSLIFEIADVGQNIELRRHIRPPDPF